MDRRHNERWRTSVLGRLLLGRSRSPLFCRVVDLSDTGARLKSAEPDAIPDRFALEIPSEDLVRESEVRWRNGREIGIRFK